MTNEEKSIIEQSAIAHKNYEDLLSAKMGAMANTIIMAQLLYENNQNSYWKTLGYDSFEEFLAIPELKFRRSKAYDLIAIYKLYCQELSVPTDRLLKAGTANLTRLMRKDAIDLVRMDTEEWIGKAESLSKSDFSETIAEAVGDHLSSPPPPSPRPSSPMECINGCGPGEKAHMPITRKAGGQEVEDWWVPACRACHTEYHQDPKEWVWKYRKNWARYLYGLINRGE